LALSKSSNANEAAAAAAAANKLIDQYRLAESEFETSSYNHEEVCEDSDALYESGRTVQWKASLACHLANHYGCAILNKKYHNHKNHYTLIGRKSDIEVVRYMFSWLCLEIERLKEEASSGHRFDRSAGKIFANSFCLGVVDGIRAQLITSRKEVIKDASSMALVKLDQRLTEANDFMYKNYNVKNKSNHSRSYINPNAYEAGKVRGSNIHLGSSLNANCGARLLCS
jgi:hypothetical protein